MDEPVLFREPVQASVLLEQLQRRQASSLNHTRLQTGVGDIDDYLLLGGVQKGCVVGVSSSGAGDEGIRSGRSKYAVAGDATEGLAAGRLLTLHILAKSILSCPSAHASVIDSSGLFPLSVLAQVVRWHVLKDTQSSPVRDLGSGNQHGRDERSIDSRVNEILERVSITRVFDIEGLWEVLGEVNYDAGQTTTPKESKGLVTTIARESNTLDKEPGVLEKKEYDKELNGTPARAVAPEIMDSEQEDDDDDLDFDAHRPLVKKSQSPNIIPSVNANKHQTPESHVLAKDSEKDLTTDLVLVDNMTTLINDLFARTEKSTAHKLLTQLARTLSSMTRPSSLTVFLLNTLTKHFPGKISNSQDRQLSIFAAMTSTPSQGMIFDSFVDLHLLCHSLPSGMRDAEKLYAADSLSGEDDGDMGNEEHSRIMRARHPTAEVEEDIQLANVVEVLKDECPQLDRWDGVSGDDMPKKSVNREQRWATFRITGGVGLANIEFGSDMNETHV